MELFGTYISEIEMKYNSDNLGWERFYADRTSKRGQRSWGDKFRGWTADPVWISDIAYFVLLLLFTIMILIVSIVY